MIELMIVVAIVGVLAVAAMPKYQDYSVRARLAEAVQLLSAARVSVAEYAIASGEMPPNLQAAGLGEISSDVVESIGYAQRNGDGILTVKLRNTGSDEVNGRFFSMVGQDARGVIRWRCQPGDSQGLQPVPVRFLPATCRLGAPVS
ncbi:pilin [Paludibacterium purpuratum]|uniref:pilin n=1 Tax=Paludibacterium purpuratum TaxID=1144873 RepID=UPI0014153047